MSGKQLQSVANVQNFLAEGKHLTVHAVDVPDRPEALAAVEDQDNIRIMDDAKAIILHSDKRAEEFSAANGLEWYDSGTSKPSRGQELKSVKLDKLLRSKVGKTPRTLTADEYKGVQEELEKSGVHDLRKHDYVQSGGAYFVPGGVNYLGLYKRAGTETLHAGVLPTFRHNHWSTVWLKPTDAAGEKGKVEWVVQASSLGHDGPTKRSSANVQLKLRGATPLGTHRHRGRPDIECRLVDSTQEIELWESPAVLLYAQEVQVGTAEPDEERHIFRWSLLGVYRRVYVDNQNNQLFRHGRPMFQHVDHRHLWLSSTQDENDTNRGGWKVRRLDGSSEESCGYLCLAVASTPTHSTRWQWHDGVKWNYWPELRCRPVSHEQLAALKSVSTASALSRAQNSNAKGRLVSEDAPEFLGAKFLYEPVILPPMRQRSFDLFHKWHTRLGIQLDSSKQEPTIKTVWPTFFFRTNFLSAMEEERGFARYQEHRKQKLVNKLAKGGVITEDDANFLQALSEADAVGGGHHLIHTTSDVGMQLAGDSLMPSTGALWRPGKGSRWDWSAPGQKRWDCKKMSRRIMFVPDVLRDQPRPGDKLLLIDGQRAPLGERGEDGDEWDHSRTYQLLERAGMKPFHGKGGRNLKEAEDQVREEFTNNKAVGGTLKTSRRVRGLKMLHRLWSQRISEQRSQEVRRQTDAEIRARNQRDEERIAAEYPNLCGPFVINFHLLKHGQGCTKGRNCDKGKNAHTMPPGFLQWAHDAKLECLSSLGEQDALMEMSVQKFEMEINEYLQTISPMEDDGDEGGSEASDEEAKLDDGDEDEEDVGGDGDADDGDDDDGDRGLPGRLEDDLLSVDNAVASAAGGASEVVDDFFNGA